MLCGTYTDTVIPYSTVYRYSTDPYNCVTVREEISPQKAHVRHQYTEGAEREPGPSIRRVCLRSHMKSAVRRHVLHHREHPWVARLCLVDDERARGAFHTIASTPFGKCQASRMRCRDWIKPEKFAFDYVIWGRKHPRLLGRMNTACHSHGACSEAQRRLGLNLVFSSSESSTIDQDDASALHALPRPPLA